MAFGIIHCKSNLTGAIMSKMADLSLEIENLLDEGYSPMSISVQLQIPLHFVYDVLETMSMQDEVDN